MSLISTAAAISVPAALGSGVVIGGILSLLGAGGSILAVPLLLYGVGLSDPHTAVGTAAAAVAANALIALWRQTRANNVRWRCGLLFASTGVVGAWIGTLLGKALDGQQLLAIFGAVMLVVGLASMRRTPDGAGELAVRLTRDNAARIAPRLSLAGLGAGAASGFFGIGGGFLVVPGLMAAAGMPLRLAMGTSLIAVAAFGLTALGSYAASGWVDWMIAGLLAAGGLLGVMLGNRLAKALGQQGPWLNWLFASVVMATGAFVLWRGVAGLV